MPLPNDIRQQVQQRLSEYCERRIPDRVRDRVRLGYKIRGNNVTLFEERPGFLDRRIRTQTVVAPFRFDPENSTWVLYCADRNSRWHEYYDIAPSKDLDDLLREVDEDPTGIFWG